MFIFFFFFFFGLFKLHTLRSSLSIPYSVLNAWTLYYTKSQTPSNPPISKIHLLPSSSPSHSQYLCRIRAAFTAFKHLVSCQNFSKHSVRNHLCACARRGHSTAAMHIGHRMHLNRKGSSRREAITSSSSSTRVSCGVVSLVRAFRTHCP